MTKQQAQTPPKYREYKPILTKRAYGYLDFIRLPFRYVPLWSSILVLMQLVGSLMPLVAVPLNANLLNTAIAVVNKTAPFSQVVPWIVLTCVVTLYQYITGSINAFIYARVEMRLRLTLRTEIFERRAALAYKHIESHGSWDTVHRVIQAPENDVMDAFGTLLNIVGTIISTVSVLVMLAVYVWWMAPAIVLVTAPVLFLSVKNGKRTYAADKEASKHQRKYEYLYDVQTGRDTAAERTIFDYSQRIADKTMTAYDTAVKLQRRVRRSNFLTSHSVGVLAALVSIAITAALIEPCRSGAISIGLFISLINAGRGLAGTLSWGIGWQLENLSRKREFMRDLTDLMAFDITPGALEPPAEPFALHSLEFRDVSFTYPETEKPVLQNVSFTITSGRHYAMVGKNGCGKTTITKLMIGLYDNYTGEILVNGRELRSYSQAQLKALYSVVFQDFGQYKFSMRDNIQFGRINQPPPSEEEMVEIIDFVGLENAADKLKEGLDTPLGKLFDNGVDLSGGEWQRVAMARSMASPASFKVLDEPTASLDPLAESRVYSQFESLSRGKTTLFISHRLGSTTLADIIFVIDEGRLLQQGSHAELMAEGGLYAEMYESQRGWYL